MKTRKKAIVVARETTYGVAPAISTGTLMLVAELSRNPYQGNTVERTRLREAFGGDAQINTGPNTQVTITTPWSGSGVAPTAEAVVAPAVGLLMRASGMTEVQDLQSGEVQYHPLSEDGDSVTLFYLRDGELQMVTGVRGTVTATANTGANPTLQFTMTGLYQRPVPAEKITLSPENQADEVPVNFLNTTSFSVQGREVRGQSFSLDYGNTVNYRNLVNYEGVHIDDRACTGQVNFEAPHISEWDVFQRTESHQVVSTGAILFEHGTRAGNIVGVRTVKSQLTGISEQDQDGNQHYQLDARHLPDTGDDELAFYFK